MTQVQETQAQTTQLQDLAVETAKALQQRVGIDGVIVIIVRKGDDSFGVGYSAPEIPVDTMLMSGVEALALVRRNAIVMLKAAQAATEGQEGQP